MEEFKAVILDGTRTIEITLVEWNDVDLAIEYADLMKDLMSDE